MTSSQPIQDTMQRKVRAAVSPLSVQSISNNECTGNDGHKPNELGRQSNQPATTRQGHGSGIHPSLRHLQARLACQDDFDGSSATRELSFQDLESMVETYHIDGVGMCNSRELHHNTRNFRVYLARASANCDASTRKTNFVKGIALPIECASRGLAESELARSRGRSLVKSYQERCHESLTVNEIACHPDNCKAMSARRAVGLYKGVHLSRIKQYVTNSAIATTIGRRPLPVRVLTS